MGLTNVHLRVSDLSMHRSEEGDFLVDSGAQYTVLPEPMWRTLKIEPHDEVRAQLADGSVTYRKTGTAWIQFETHKVASRVVLGEADDSPLLGVVTLEEMGLVLDPYKRMLYKQKFIRM